MVSEKAQALGVGQHPECKSPRLVEEGTAPVQEDVTGRAGDDEGECVTWSRSCSSELKHSRWQ